MRSLALFLAMVLIVTVPLNAQQTGNIAFWRFDRIKNGRVLDEGTGLWDRIDGHWKVVDGVAGKALKFDGFTTSIDRDGDDAPVIKGPFSVHAWVAPQAYPWNWCAVVNQEYAHQRGWYFGLDAEGRVGLHAAVARQWRQCISEAKIPFMAWSHIAATFDPDCGIRLYINGKPAGSMKVTGDLLNDKEMDLQIGRNHKRTVPASLNRAGRVRVPASYSFDGIIDELQIVSGVMTEKEIRRTYRSQKPKAAPPLVWRKLPAVPQPRLEFGAYYTKLKYDEDWDAVWRDDAYPDIVVNFPEKYAMVFWKGTNYNMNLVTENGRWIADQSAESWGGDDRGCCEHMSDKQNRYSHVRLIENHAARVVVHWRYALTDVLYRINNVDPKTDWGDWADEYYTIYPDGVAVRHFQIHGTEDGYSVTEPTVLSNPGEKAEDNVDMEAVTLANLAGLVRTYSYETWPSNGRGGAPFTNPVPEANLTRVNLKSQFKPFYIYEPGTEIIPYGGGIREIDYRYSHFHSRNHWPVCLMPCDGRFVLAADRVTSSALTSAGPPLKRNQRGALEGRFIMGLTQRQAEDLLPLAKSWLYPSELVTPKGIINHGYSRNSRAYVIEKTKAAVLRISLTINASEEKPLLNPAVHIKRWGNQSVRVALNGKVLSGSGSVRTGSVLNASGTDLIVWIPVKAEQPVSLVIEGI